MLHLWSPPKPIILKKKNPERSVLHIYFTLRTWEVLPQTDCRKPKGCDCIYQGCTASNSSKKKKIHISFRNTSVQKDDGFCFFLFNQYVVNIAQTSQQDFYKPQKQRCLSEFMFISLSAIHSKATKMSFYKAVVL